MLKHVVKHTNERARRDLRKRSKNPDEWMPFDLCKMKDIIDVLYLIGVYRFQHESLHSLWLPGPSERAIFSLLIIKKQTAIVLLFFISFVLNFDVTRYFNNRLLLVVCSVHLDRSLFVQIGKYYTCNFCKVCCFFLKHYT